MHFHVQSSAISSCSILVAYSSQAHPFTYSFTQCTHPLNHSPIHSLLLTHLVHSPAQSLIHSLTHSFTRSLNHSPTHSLICSPVHSLARPITLSSIHLLTH